MARFLDSASSDDDAGARATSEASCCEKERERFVRQAGRRFQARFAAPARRGRDRAVVGVEVLRSGGRKCDLVYLLLARSDGAWRVRDVTESADEATAWAP